MRRSAAAWLTALCLLLPGCSGGEERTAQEWTRLYQEAITAHGGEMVAYNPIFTQIDPEDATAELVLQSLGLEEADMAAFAVSASVMNTRAYAIAAVQPAQGREEAVREALQGYISRQQSSFEFYLPDQYQIAQDARLETLEDGTVLLVMCQDQDVVFDAIRTQLERA